MTGPPRSMSRQGRRAALALLLALAAGCAVLRPQAAAPPVDPAAGHAAVFVADGAGNFQIASKMLRSVSRSCGCPIEVVTYEWSHGYGRMISDQLCFQHARQQGKGLAAAVCEYREQHPGTPIYLLGHSAGSTVIMSALESLPPDSVERAVLLSPSLSACYDVRPALQTVRCGLHVFYSPYDYWYLGVITRVVGSADRFWCPTSGRVGFDTPPAADESWLYSKLYQRPWQPDDRQLGNNGGHYGNYQPDFLRQHILPLFEPAPPR